MKKNIQIIFITALFFLSAKSFAQFNQTWIGNYQHTSAANFSNESRKAIVDASGNTFVLADATSDMDINGVVTGTTYHYVILIKYDASNNMVMQDIVEVFNHNTVGFDNFSAFGLALDGSGNVYAGYNCYDTAAPGNFDIRVRIYDNGLTMLDEQKYGTSGNDYGIDMAVNPAGTVGVLMKSVSGANTQFYLLQGGIGLTLDMIITFDMNLDYPTALIIEPGNIYFVTGYRLAGTVKSALISRIDNTIGLKWKKIYNGGSVARDDFGTDLTMGADGMLYIVGTSDRGTPNNNDAMVLKLVPISGKLLWESFQHYGSNDNGRLIFAPALDFVYIGSVSSNTVFIDRLKILSGNRSGRGVYQPNPVEPHTAINGVTLADMKVSSVPNFYITGSVQATDMSAQPFSASYLAKFYIDNHSRNVFKMQFDLPAEGNAVLSYTASGISFDNVNQDILWMRDKINVFSTHQYETVQLIRFSVPSPLKEMNSTISSANTDGFQMMPNPASEYLYISLFPETLADADSETLENGTITIADMTGKIILQITDSQLPVEINVSSLDAGIYMCRYVKGDEAAIKKLVIE